VFGFGGIGIGARGWSGASVAAPVVAPPSPLATQSQQVPILIVAEKLLPIIQAQSFPLDIVASKNSLTAPLFRTEVALASITLGAALRLTGTSPAVTLAAGTGTLTYTGAAVPGIKVEIQTSTTFRISYNGGSTWDASGITIPTGSTYTVPSGKPAVGNLVGFPAGTYVTGDTYAGTVATLRSTEGNSYTFTNTTVAQQPVYRHASDPANPEVRAGLHFGGAQYLLSTDAATVASFANDPAYTLLYRVAYTSATAQGWVISAGRSDDNTNRRKRYGVGSSSGGRHNYFWRNDAAGTATHVSTANPITTPQNVCWQSPGSNGGQSLRLNDVSGALGVSASNIGTLTPNRVGIGADIKSTVAEFLNGHVYDIAMFSTSLSGADLSAWNAELAA
jgi:hypothetical protein